MATKSPTTFQTPIPRELAARISAYMIVNEVKNSAQFLFEATNALFEKTGEPPVKKSVMEEFVPYRDAYESRKNS